MGHLSGSSKLSYKNHEQTIGVNQSEENNLTIELDEKLIPIAEVMKSAKEAEWGYAYNIFKKYFLGDPTGLICYLENPKDMYFYFEGSALFSLNSSKFSLRKANWELN